MTSSRLRLVADNTGKFYVRADFLRPVPGATPRLTVDFVTVPYTGLHTDEALDAWRKAENAKGVIVEGIVRHFSRVTLMDSMKRPMRSVTQPVFEVA